MNPFDVLANVQRDYLTYVRTFQRFQNPRIREWVMDRIKHGTLLWKPPFVQLSRPFAPGDTLQTLIEEGLFHLMQHLGDGLLCLFIAGSQRSTDATVVGQRDQTPGPNGRPIMGQGMGPFVVYSW